MKISVELMKRSNNKLLAEVGKKLIVKGKRSLKSLFPFPLTPFPTYCLKYLCNMSNSFPQIGLVLLAAGASTRMGTPKQLLPYQGRSLIRYTAEVALASVCRPIVVVLGASAELIEPELAQLAVQVVKNPQWHQGMSSSIRVGVKAIAQMAPLDAVVIALGDQPLISAAIINGLVERYQRRHAIIACEYSGTIGVPALFSRCLFPELINLKGTAGAKGVLKKHADSVLTIQVPEAAVDLDTPADYEQLLSSHSILL